MIYPELPIKAISVRQPWAWALIHGGKDIENRSWRLPREFAAPKRVAIHASLYSDPSEEKETWDFMRLIGVNIRPALGNVWRGGIIGSVLITGCVQESVSPWFFGPYGFTIADPLPCEFIPCKGALGFFNWRDKL